MVARAETLDVMVGRVKNEAGSEKTTSARIVFYLSEALLGAEPVVTLLKVNLL